MIKIILIIFCLKSTSSVICQTDTIKNWTNEELNKFIENEKLINHFHRLYFGTSFLWQKGGYNFEIGFGKKFTFSIAAGLKSNIDIISQQIRSYQCSNPNTVDKNYYKEECSSSLTDFFIEPEFKYIFKRIKKRKNKIDLTPSYRLNIDGWYTSVQAFIVNGNVDFANKKAWGGHIFNNWGFQGQSKKIFFSIYAGYILYTLKDLPNTTIFNVMNFGINLGYNLK